MKLPIFILIAQYTLYTLITYILIHFLAFMGIFYGLFYPLWWLFFPKKTACFIRKEFGKIKLCSVFKKDASGTLFYYPKNFLAALIQAFFILIVSCCCFAFVYAEAKLLFRLNFPLTKKSVTFNLPQKAQHRIGEIFPMKVEIEGNQTAINATRADLSFDHDRLKIIDVSTKDSFANIFIQKEINNEVGYMSLVGGLANPGFNGEEGTFATVFFQGIKAGLALVEFLPSSLVLANDGRGTNVLARFGSASYLILPEELTEQEKANQLVSLEARVLGEKTEKATEITQLILFEDNNVLGSDLPLSTEENTNVRPAKTILNWLETFDQLILSFWSKILSFLLK